MRWFLDLSTRGKQYLSFGLMAVLLAVVATVAYRSIALIQDSQRALYEDEFTDVLDMKEIRANQLANRADMLSLMKIDRSFVITIAEGVDAEEQAKVLRLLRCDQMQGYLFSKPLPGDQMIALLKAKG